MAIQPQASTYNAYTDPNRKAQVYPGAAKGPVSNAVTAVQTDPGKKAIVAAATTPAVNQSPTTPGMTLPRTTPGTTTPNRTMVQNAPVDAQGNTRYTELGGSDLNNILYLKSLYEGAGGNKGQQTWAAGQAGQYYSNLDPAVAAKVKGMNTQQLNDYIAGLGNTGSGAGGAVPPGGETPASNPAIDLINQMFDLSSKNLQQGAYDARNQADAINLQNAQGMQEIMANRGLGASGENITAMLNQNAQRQGSLTEINNQLAQNMNELEINKAQQLMEQYNLDEDRALQLAQLMGNYKGQRTLQGSMFDRDILESDRDYNRGILESDRNFNRGILESDRAYNRGVLESDRGYNRGVLESDRSFGEGVRQFNLGYNLDQRQLAQSAANAAADNARQWAALNWSKSASNPDNIYRNLQIEELRNSVSGAGGMSRDDLSKEGSSMLQALRSGSMSPEQALTQIGDDLSTGTYSNSDANYLRSIVSNVAPQFQKPALTDKELKKADPQMKSDKEIKKEAQRLGLPTMDYETWYKSANGRLGGNDYNTWKRLYGPRLTN